MKLALKWGNRSTSKSSAASSSFAPTGKSAAEFWRFCGAGCTMMKPTELQQAAEEQRQIMHIRLKKWIAG